MAILPDVGLGAPRAQVNARARGHGDAHVRDAHVRDAHVRDAHVRDLHPSGVTWRVVFLSLFIAAGLAYVIPVVDYKFFNTFLGATHLPPGALGVLLMMVLVVNPLLKLVSARLAFSRNETLTVYLSCLFSTLVVGIGGNNYFVSFIIGAFYYSTRENRWFDLLKGLPPWFTPALNADGTYNSAVVEAWYNGSRAGEGVPWTAWLVPLGAWGAFFLASFGMMACLSVMLRAQWGDHEALAFPLLRLPLEMTEHLDGHGDRHQVGFFRNPLMWWGFGVAAIIQLINGLHLYFPDVPAIVLNLNMAPYLSESPWNQIGSMPVLIYPIAVGIAFLLSREVAFSLWFFFLFFKAQLVAAYYFGFSPNTLPTMTGAGERVFIGYQEVGAYFAYFALIFWTARRHFAHILRRALGLERSTTGESREALSYPVAFWGFVGCFGIMLAWGMAAGMSFGLSLLLWGSYLVIAVVLSRVVAEGGLLFVHHNWMPLGAASQLIGMGPGTALNLGAGLVPATFLQWTTIQDYRGSLMPSFVQSFKLAHDRGIHAKKLFALLFAVILVGMVIGFQMNVRLGYENGGLGLQGWLSRWGPQGAGSTVAAMAGEGRAPSLAAWAWLLSAMALVWGMMAARARFAWFPFHPMGYLMATTYPAHNLWFSLFLGWSAKTLISRFGGQDSARRATPLFLGLALGDVAMMLFWIAIDGWQGRTAHQLMPG